MKRVKKDQIVRRLLRWWDAGHRDLPWRFPQDAADPYRVWVAEVMLQQTRVPVVVPYYGRFVERFPTLESLAAADEEDVLALWSGLGYYARGRRLLEAARDALARHGQLPSSLEELRALPGFGPYTAGAVASIAFAVRAPCVDGNAARVLRRVLVLDDVSTTAGRARAWAAAAGLVPGTRPGDFNQALMELGALVCTPRRPACGRCPLVALCGARRAGGDITALGARRRRRPAPRAVLACALVRRGPGVLLVRHRPGGLFGGLWGLPSVVVPEGEDGRDRLAAEVEATTGLRVRPGDALAEVERVLTHRRLRLVAYDCGEVPAHVALQAGCAFHLLADSGMSPPPTGSVHRGGISTAMRVLLGEVPRSGQNTLTRRGVPV